MPENRNTTRSGVQDSVRDVRHVQLTIEHNDRQITAGIDTLGFHYDLPFYDDWRYGTPIDENPEKYACLSSHFLHPTTKVSEEDIKEFFEDRRFYYDETVKITHRRKLLYQQVQPA